ncbi:MAG TPA: hypothetical protein VGQ67_07245 [Candidatus Polarisedimenticolia bacterium]|jgi:hypothetical protein|nr:hypothetical protein [Candidatus Polarisedimenticolia bacterium]
MTCKQVRDYMRRSGDDIAHLDNLPPEVSAHLRSCTGCLSQRRVVWLMRMGSGAENGAPAPGFEDRLRQRLAEPPAAAATSFAEESMGPIFAGLARPALMAASLVAALSLAAYLSVSAGVFSGGGPDLSLLASADRHNDAILEDWGKEP